MLEEQCHRNFAFTMFHALRNEPEEAAAAAEVGKALASIADSLPPAEPDERPEAPVQGAAPAELSS